MPSRRSVLAGGVAVGATVAGYAALAGPPGTDATVRSGMLDAPDAESAPIVARTVTRSDDHGCPEGLVREQTRVHEVRRSGAPNDLVLVTEYDVFTGESNCSTGWGQTGIAVGHRWRTDALPDGGPVADHGSNVVPTGDEGDRQATLERLHTTTAGDWRVHLTPPTKSTTTYRFASTAVGAGSPADGTALVETAADVGVRKGWLGGSDTLRTRTTLRYGDDAG